MSARRNLGFFESNSFLTGVERMANNDGTMYFEGEERAEKVTVFLKKGYEEANLTKKVTLFTGDNLPTVYTLTNNKSEYVMRNVLAFAPETAKHRLSFPVLAESENPENREIYRHSNMRKFRCAINADGSPSTQRESYRIQFHSTEELSRILDELIALYRNDL